jgi:Arc/MetJ-type ribon-helix-helix transcriptional regulator
MQVKAGRREDKFNEDFDAEKAKWNKQIGDLKGGLERTLAEKGATGVVSEYGSQLKELTGQDIKVVGGQVVLQQNGKTVSKFDVRELPSKIESALEQHYTHGFADTLVKKGMFKNASDVISYQQKRQELDIGERGVKVKEAIAPSEIAKNYGAAKMYSDRGAGGGGGAAGKAATAQQMVDDGLAPDITAAYRIMASKDARSSVDQDWARTRLEIVKANPGATAAELSKAKETFYAENGVAPQALADAVTSGINPQTGKPFDPASADKIISDFNKKYPASKVDKADLSWTKTKDKADTGKADSAIPAKGKGPSNFYSSEAAAARKAEREARDAAAAEEERKKREAADAQSAKMRSAIAADFNSKYGR